MNHPSSRVTANSAIIAIYKPGQDVDAGTNSAEVPVATAHACSLQPQSVERVVDDQMRTATVTVWSAIFAADPGLNLGDKVSFTLGVRSHVAFVAGVIDYAGRGAAWEVAMEERA